MSNMSNLDLVLDEMITAGQKMIEAATALREIFSETAAPEKVTEAPATEVTTEPEVKTYTFQEVRGIMANLSGKGKKAEAKTLLTKYGASRLSEVKEADYAALVAEAEVVLNG
jgi:hypothetical protein